MLRRLALVAPKATILKSVLGSQRSIFTSKPVLQFGALRSNLKLEHLNKSRSFAKPIFANRVFSRNAATVTKPLLNSSKSVGYWLIGSSGLVFGIVVLGGLTRLTESGLSITEWKPVTGTLPPLSQHDWEVEFEKYKASPEFQQLNSSMTLDEYKFIYFMEWIHRVWGRAIGVAFLLPAAYFVATRKTTRRVTMRLTALACLLGFQGFLGWYMVQSGLDQEQLDDRRSKPTVSQYRLTSHLGTAFVLYLGMIWTGFEIIKEAKWIKEPEKAMQLFSKLESKGLRPVRICSVALLVLAFTTALSGGLVAGLDAGLIYNTFPHMGDNWIPSKRELLDDTFARKEDASDLVWRNMLENPTTVQLTHRFLATTTFVSVLALHLYCNRKAAVLPKSAKMMVHGMMGIVTLQFALGACTLLYLVPTPLASAHQAGALCLLTTALLFAAQLRKPRIPMKLLISTLNKKQVAGDGKIFSAVSNVGKHGSIASSTITHTK